MAVDKEVRSAVSELVDDVAVLKSMADDVAVLKNEVMSARWQQVAANFTQAAENFAEINKRLKAVEDAIERNP
jgi:hypothetical protein